MTSVLTDPERWEFIERIFHRVVGLSPRERSAELARACGDDDDARAHVERLLRLDADTKPDPLDEWIHAPGLASDPMLGREIGAYRLTSRVALGGMGVVYRACRIDGQFERDVAIKLIRPDIATDAGLRRFDFERKTLAGLVHPNIARLYDSGITVDGSPYIVLEFVDGEHIDRYCARNSLTVDDRLRLFVTTCRAVHFAHRNLVIHRDLKPGNILVDASGAPKLLDFGIARLVQVEDDGPPDGQPTVFRLMTPEYASPEQLGGAALTTATDVYSLGVILYRLLTGREPFRVATHSSAEWERIVAERVPTRPSTAVFGDPESGDERSASERPEDFAATCRATPSRLRRRISGDLDRIVLMALRKEPDRRYASAQEFADDIERHLAGEPVVARGDSTLYRAVKFVRRNRLVVASAVFVLGAMVFGLAAARRGEHIATEQAERARIESESFRSVSQFLVDTFLGSDRFVDESGRETLLQGVRSQAERVRRIYSRQPLLRANLLDSLGGLLTELDRFDDATILFEEALAIRESLAGEQSLDVALSCGSLGRLAYRRGDDELAVDWLTRALALQRTCSPASLADVAGAANDLASALRRLGRIDEAENLHREALGLRHRSDPKSLAVAESWNNLAGISMTRADFDDARRDLEQALAIRRELLGHDHVLTLQSLSNLAAVTSYLGDQERAREMFVEAADGFRSIPVQGLDGLGKTLSSLATLDLQMGRYDDAESDLEEALRVQVSHLAPDHPTVLSLLSRTALLRERQGRNHDARELWELVVARRRASSAPPHVDLARALQEYGIFLLRAGDLARAESILGESVNLLAAAPAGDTALDGRAHIGLGVSLLFQREFERAEVELSRGLELLEATQGVPAQDVEEARNYLTRLEEARSATR